MLLITLAAMAAVAFARPSYIAVPADQITFVDLRNLVRVPRQILTPPPLSPLPPQLPQGLYNQDYQLIPIEHVPASTRPNTLAPQEPQQARLTTLQQEPQDAVALQSYDNSRLAYERPADFGEYVDFGAHTGDQGAFGWYADYPISNHEDSSYRK